MLVIGSNAHRYSISSFMDWFLMGLRMLFPRDDCHTRSGMSKEVLNLSRVPDPAHPSGSGTKSQDSSHLHWREARSGAWCESLECGGQTFLHQVSVAPDLFHKSGWSTWAGLETSISLALKESGTVVVGRDLERSWSPSPCWGGFLQQADRITERRQLLPYNLKQGHGAVPHTCRPDRAMGKAVPLSSEGSWRDEQQEAVCRADPAQGSRWGRVKELQQDHKWGFNSTLLVLPETGLYWQGTFCFFVFFSEGNEKLITDEVLL